MKRIPLVVAVASALSLWGCQSEQPYTIQAPPPGTAPATQPGPVKPAPLTGTAGPLAQAGIGKYMDGLETDLRLRLRGYRVARRGNDLLLVIPNDKLFAGAKLSSSGGDLLAAVAKVFCHYDHTQLLVNGYTDTSGSAESNLAVSQKRAGLVGDALAGEGVAASRIEAHGLGATNLKVATGDGVSEPRNRRIEIRVLPKPG